MNGIYMVLALQKILINLKISNSLNIKYRLNILTVLQKAGYGPNANGTYNSTDVTKAIKDKIGQVEP